MQENNGLSKSVRYLKGVGPKRSDDLAELGIKTVEDMICYLPARYEDRSKIVNIRDLKMGEAQAIEGQIISVASRRTKAGLSMFQAGITDKTGLIYAVWFNQPYLKDYLIKSMAVTLYGKVDRYNRVQIMNPEYEILKEGGPESVHMKRIVPVYPASGSLSVKYLRGLAFQAAAQYSRFLTEHIPTYIIAREHLVDVKFAFRNIHFPASFENLEKAYRRIVFEEFFLLQLALAMRKAAVKEGSGLRHKAGGELIEELKRALPFNLTEGQKRAISDIERDMSSAKPMNRLLEGDVGSGKTVVAAHSLVLTVQNGFQGCLMAPTEVLARQHFIGLSELLMPLGINIALLTGGMDPETKSRIHSDIKEGRVNIIVGTHAIIQEAVEFKRLGIAIVDEQHKFGVDQRVILRKKGDNPHMLVMTATPIPRTLALTVYGDLDISVIKEMPKGRLPIVTYWVEEEKRDRAYDFIREEVQKGRQAYVICPRIDESPEPDAGEGLYSNKSNKTQNVTETFDRLKEKVFAGHEVGLLHGKMASKDKERIMKSFKKGKIKVLVSTVVIDVGIDVPNATVMLVENADLFGLSQLHQLRGRIGRGEHKSYCILLADPKTEEASVRLKAIEGTLDGFQIAEADLEIRGPGEFFGTRQHGLPEIRFGNILKDFGIMELARKEAFGLVGRDPGLKEEHHRPLKAALEARFKDIYAPVAVNRDGI